MRRRAWMISMFAACALLGCGDDDSGNPAGEDGGLDGSTGQHSGSSGHNGSNGSGGDGSGNATTGNGSGGSGTVNGAGGAGIPPAPAPVPCGSTMCQSSALTAGLIDACCADATSSTCGTSMFGGTCAAPAPSDSRCPALDLMGVFSLASCCASDGQCGIDGSQFGMGCISLADAAQGGMGMMAGLPITLPEPRACDADRGEADAGSEEDAGK
jgi:hypothetical protein